MVGQVRKALYLLAYVFALLFVLFIPFPYSLFPFQEIVNNNLFADLLVRLGSCFSGNGNSTSISSDSTLMYTQNVLLLLVSLITSVVLLLIKPGEAKQKTFFAFTRSLLFYFLSLHLMKYGLEKVFKTQFYQPEPNTLFTPFGFLDKDILFWSTIGTSYMYNIVTGSLEVLAALFLLFGRTRRAGLLLSFGLLIHICLINFSFDISVKVFSSFLLFITLLLMTPDIKNLFAIFFSANKTAEVQHIFSSEWMRNKSIKTGIKCFAICVIVLEGFYPALASGNFNDDSAPRPYLHGAYEVQAITSPNSDSIPGPDIKRLFIHRRGYLILQDSHDLMTDYKLDIDPAHNTFRLTDYTLYITEIPYSYTVKDSVLVLMYTNKGTVYTIKAKALDWRRLPALRKGFHFRSDTDY